MIIILLDHVGLVDRDHGRALSDLHRGQEAVARVRAEGRPGAETGRIEEAIDISDKYKKSHLAMVVNGGLQEFRAHQVSTEISGEEIEASKRALQRADAIKTAEFKRGLSGLATIGSTAPFVGLFGTVFGIINAFQGMKSAESAGIAAVAGGISEALFTTALGLLVAVPAVWLFNYFTSKVEASSWRWTTHRPS